VRTPERTRTLAGRNRARTEDGTSRNAAQKTRNSRHLLGTASRKTVVFDEKTAWATIISRSFKSPGQQPIQPEFICRTSFGRGETRKNSSTLPILPGADVIFVPAAALAQTDVQARRAA
jgi:hypothetical protein